MLRFCGYRMRIIWEIIIIKELVEMCVPRAARITSAGRKNLGDVIRSVCVCLFARRSLRSKIIIVPPTNSLIVTRVEVTRGALISDTFHAEMKSVVTSRTNARAEARIQKKRKAIIPPVSREFLR